MSNADSVSVPQQFPDYHIGQGTSVVFHGLNGVDPPHLIAQDEVQTSTNIDFGLEYGAAAVRRGSTRVVQISTNTAGIGSIVNVAFLNVGMGAPANTDGVIYANKGSLLYRYFGGTVTAIATATGSTAGWVGNSYKGFAYFFGGDGSTGGGPVKDNGTVTTDWIKQVPAVAPTVTVNTLAVKSVGSTYTVVEGTAGTLVGTATATADATTFRVEFDIAITTGTATNMDLNGTNTIGDYGHDSVDIWFSDPKMVTRISRDYGIGTDFTNYYHTELDMTAFESAYSDPQLLVESQLNQPPQIYGTTTFTQAIDLATRQQMLQDIRTNIRPTTTVISAAKQVFNSWIVARPDFQPVIRDPQPGSWSAVGTGRIVIEGTGAFSAQVRNWQVIGAKSYSLADIDNGYAWWETFATFDANSGGIVGESGPSPATARTKVQGVNVTLTSTNTATGTSHGITHRIFYRQGGYLNDSYAVGTITYGSTGTFTDTITDIEALSLNLRMVRNLKTPAEFSPLPRAVSEPWYDRLFYLASNTLSWTMPGRPDAFPRTSDVIIGDGGDIGCALVVWPPGMVAVMDHSIWEMVGTVFEGVQADYVLSRTGSKHGSKAPLATIKTPHGILLFDYDGLYFYIPGQGIEKPIDWIMAKVGDMWRGQGATDPSAYKGSRLPAIDLGQIFYSCAAFANNTLYIGVPCETGQSRNNYIIAANFTYQNVSLFNYPFTFNSLYWDQYKNKLFALTAVNGQLMQLETGITDSDDTGTETPITYNFKTRSWPAPNDILMENIALQYRGGTSTLLGIYDQTSASVISTNTSDTKVWTIPTLGGTISNDIVFQLAGTQTSSQNAFYNIAWDAWTHPKRTMFYRTDYWEGGIQGEKIWDVHYTDASIFGSSGTLTGTVLATSFVDNVAVATFTLVGVSEKKRYEFAYPPETYGNIEYTIYQGQ